jgi:hypothetical protein
MHACNPSTWETEVGGLRIQGQPGPHSETISKTGEKTKTKKTTSTEYKVIRLGLKYLIK